MTIDEASVVSDLTPTLRLGKGAAGKPAPVGRISDNLQSVLVSVMRRTNERGSDFGLVDEIFGGTAAEVNHRAGR